MIMHSQTSALLAILRRATAFTMLAAASVPATAETAQRSMLCG
jgi:hypothetical protein